MLASVLASLVPSDKWFIRVVDLVREPMSYGAALLLFLGIFVKWRWRWVTVALFAATIAINVARIWPYSELAATQFQLADQADSRCFSALSANVKVKNREFDRLVSQIRRYDPDLLFLMETDRRWVDALGPLLDDYPHVQSHPQAHAFGLVFASRVPVAKSNIVENTYRDTPTLYTTLQVEGAPVEFIGLHPKPPLPGWNS